MSRICLLINCDCIHHLITTSANVCLNMFFLTHNLIVQDVTANDGRAIASKYQGLC